MLAKEKSGLVAALILLFMVCPAAPQTPKQSEPKQGNSTIRVKVEMVSLPVVVTDSNGAYVTDLKKDDFRIYEDGIPQDIAAFSAVEEPISVALVLDTSNSTESQLTRIRNEAIRFVGLLRNEDGLAVVSFADQVTLWQHFDIYRKKNTDVIRRIQPGGLSAVYEAVWLTIEQVLKHEYGRKALVLFSDGIDTRSSTVTKEETLRLARETEATIYCIYFNTAKDRNKLFPRMGIPWNEASRPELQLNQWPPIGRGKRPEYEEGFQYMLDLSKYSGGLLADASRTKSLSLAFEKIAAELSSQYSLGYYPKDLQRYGAFHRVEVSVKGRGLSARTKQGYYAD